MIFETYKTLEDLNATGIQGILQTSSEAVWYLPALILFAIFIILAYTSYTVTKRRFGRGDLLSSLAVAGFVAVVVSILMSLIPNFIQTRIIVITIVLEIIFAFGLITSKE